MYFTRTTANNFLERSRSDNPIRRKLRVKKIEAGEKLVSVDVSFSELNAFQAGGIITAAGPKRPAVQMPDEYLPPNKILFLQNLPETVTKDQLTLLFSQFVY